MKKKMNTKNLMVSFCALAFIVLAIGLTSAASIATIDQVTVDGIDAYNVNDVSVVAGEYARWYALLMFFNFINKPCVVTIPVLKLQLFQLIYEIFSTLLKAAALFAGFYFFKSDFVAVALFSITGVLLYIVLIMYVILESRNTSER